MKITVRIRIISNKQGLNQDSILRRTNLWLQTKGHDNNVKELLLRMFYFKLTFWL